jgi:hypothetical protein
MKRVKFNVCRKSFNHGRRGFQIHFCKLGNEKKCRHKYELMKGGLLKTAMLNQIAAMIKHARQILHVVN